jgi:hypothetical protein
MRKSPRTSPTSSKRVRHVGILRDTSDNEADLRSNQRQPAGSLLTAPAPDSGGAYVRDGRVAPHEVPEQAVLEQAVLEQAVLEQAAPAQAAPTQAAPAQAAPTATPLSEPTSGASGRTELERRREALAVQVTELHWDLGGLAYEMAIRDHFRLDVLVRRAATLQERDAELAEVERLLRMEQDGVAGSCPECKAPHSRGALFCWQCGTALMERLPSSSAATDE